MSIERQEGTIWFLCDRCSNALDTEERDFAEALIAMKAAGWSSWRDRAGEWEHICTEHRAA